MERVGIPSEKFASRGVHNICLGPRSKIPELRGNRILVAIFDKRDYVVRELREEPLPGALPAEDGKPPQTRIVDVCADDGAITVLLDDARTLAGNPKAWGRLLEDWSQKYGVPQ